MRASVAGLCLFLCSLAVQAGNACQEQPLGDAAFMKGMELGAAVYHRLDASGDRVALVARAGTDLSEYQLDFSHVGIAYRTGSTWRVLHLVNVCGEDYSVLRSDGLGRFFLDDLWRYRAKIVYLSPALQDRMLALIAPGHALRFHQPRYNVISNPARTKYQNCNHFALDAISGAHLDAPAAGLVDVHATPLRQRFVPDVLRIPYTRRIAGGLFSDTAVFTDHKMGTRISGKYPLVTVRSIIHFLTEQGLALRTEELDSPCGASVGFPC